VSNLKKTGESLQQYIGRYKIKLIETRFCYAGKRISEIAYEFGFAAESHLHVALKSISEQVHPRNGSSFVRCPA
jgi:AraC-like DNA-binding protein